MSNTYKFVINSTYETLLESVIVGREPEYLVIITDENTAYKIEKIIEWLQTIYYSNKFIKSHIEQHLEQRKINKLYLECERLYSEKMIRKMNRL